MTRGCRKVGGRGRLPPQQAALGPNGRKRGIVAFFPSHGRGSRGAMLGSSAEQRATELREAHREKVARNEVRDSPLWAQPCRAYNVQIELEPLTRSSLEKIQQSLYQAEPNLLACPRQSLHVSIAWLLAVHASYPVPKDSLWERHGEEWTTELDRIAAQSKGFRIAYEHVVATDSAVIALAEPTEPVNRIRKMIRERLRLPAETHNEADPLAPAYFFLLRLSLTVVFGLLLPCFAVT